MVERVFTFGIEQEKAFQKLKDTLIQAPVLKIFYPALSKRVLADTQGFTSGPILEQLVDAHWHPVEYFSKSLSDVDNRQLVSEREILVCILALERWRPYLIGQPFDIPTNHASLQFYISQPKLS